MIEIGLSQMFAGSNAVAAGATLGNQHFQQMLQMLPSSLNGGEVETAIVCNLEGIEDATPSYIKATVLALHQCGRLFARTLTLDENVEIGEGLRPLNTVTLIRNASESVADCIHEVFARRELAIFSGTDLGPDRFVSATLLGQVDAAGLKALDLACGFEEFQAADLHRIESASAISVTGWNNRLAELHRQRLIRRRTEGRVNRFIPLVQTFNLYGQILLRK